MLKALRRKFVVMAMAAVTVLLLVLLGGINGVNLWLDNAVKYAEPGTEIGLTLGREGGAAVLRVWNRCTQPPQEPERLFDRFYREDTARTQSAGGTGLGLSIARAIMEGEGGGLSARVKPGGTIEFEARWKSART